MRARLFASFGPEAGLEVEFGAEATIGRGKENRVLLSSPEVSQHHARIAFDAESAAYWVEDLGSLNGTLLDGEPLSGRQRLGALHVLSFGPGSDLFFVELDRQPAAAPEAEAPEAEAPKAEAPAGSAPAAEATADDAGTRTEIDAEAPTLPIGLREVDEVDRTRADGEAPTLPAGLQAPAAGGRSARPGSATRVEPQPAELPASLASPPARRFVLEVPGAGGGRFELRPGDNLVGRSSRARVSLRNRELSRRHATLRVADDRVWLRDEGSRNHTFVAGEPIREEVELAPGSVLRFGRLEARLTLAEDGAGDGDPGMSGAEILDLLVVGGGPAGTAAAFRAKELGLEPLVVDYDDLMKRIRDYSKDKRILPDFGGGDRQCFPRGGELIERLRFAPIDKDDMCAGWKGLYAEHGVRHEVGLEVTSLEPGDDGAWAAAMWDHVNGRERRLAARHVVLALGRGVPRRFDIPGDCDGIAYKLADPEAFAGRPALVVGGGTSAAEAVIAISQAKAAAADPTAVYWSYRGSKMPRVSKALADAFFAAYVGNGNIHYCRRSEPAAMVTGDDKKQYLAIRVDRRSMEGRPTEAIHLEFAREQVLACIGEDLPRALLSSFGIEMVAGGPKGRTRMAVNRYLESRRPNLYLVGDLLSQAYFETEDFDADPAGFREVKHRGNIKSALRDGVLVAQVIQQRLAGSREVDVRIEEYEPDAAPPAAVRSVVLADDRPGPPAASLEPGRVEEHGPGGGGAVLIRVLPTGVEEAEHAVRAGGVTTIGRAGCDVSFPNDESLAERHASISHSEDGYALRDDGGASGVFLRVPAARKRRLGDGDLLRAGRQFLLVSRGEEGYAITHYDAAGAEVGRHPLTGKAVICGRQAPDLILDADDPTLSRRHLAFATENGGLWVKDLKSVNGTYLRVRAAERLEHGDQIHVGRQQLTFSRRPEEALDAGSEAAAAAPEVVEAAAAADGVAVTFQPAGRVVQVAPGETICEAAERCGVEINAECHSGICGSDPIRVLSGAENLAGEVGEQERETLEELCEVEPGPCRLACLARATGPVEVEIL